MDSKSKYIDLNAVLQIIGCVYNNIDLLEKYSIKSSDFTLDFHKVVFGCMIKLYDSGVKKITIHDIEEYLAKRPNEQKIYTTNEGGKFLTDVSAIAQNDNFDYYYTRLKKFSLLRAYDDLGVDVSFIYDPANVLDIVKRQKQENYLENSSLEELITAIDIRLSEVKEKFAKNLYSEHYQAGSGLKDLIAKFKKTPDVGSPLYGGLVNTVTRGARLKKFYLRSAPTGWGKTRMMIADVCSLACDMIYDERFGWIKNGPKQPTLYISTELELDEVQTMMLAFLSNVEEQHIVNAEYEGDEEERVAKAIEILEASPLFVEIIPDFTLRDIEDTIRRNIRENGVKYIGYDYLHTSLGILSEITKSAGGVKLREDNVLFMLSIKIKDLCNQYGVFIISSTQLNADYATSQNPDQNLLRGAKAIADKIDAGWVILPVSAEDLKVVEGILSTGCFELPNVKLCFYKNRRSPYKNVYIWCKVNLGTCRTKTLFATTYDYELLTMDELKIEVKDEEE